MFRTATFFVIVLAASCAHAQWRMLDTGSTASFRGIHSVSDRIAWASGTAGTVLRTIDGGEHWQKCTVPAGAEKLDFRGIWAWSDKEAMVMASGPGEQSRLYSTTDAWAHWTLVQTNTERDGFWDGIFFQGRRGVLVGDPLHGRFDTEFLVGQAAPKSSDHACAARDGEAAFAASNSSVYVFGPRQYILGTGGKGGPRALLSPELAKQKDCLGIPVPVASGNQSSGVFSLYFRDRKHGVAVGGDYQKPNESAGTAAFTSDGGLHWTAASNPPHGYRSAVTWDRAHKAWIAVGTNGSDISFDDGKSWKRLDDGNWNGVALPFAVGPKGRIGRIEDSALSPKTR
ncbi:MAG: hypothetical protein ACRD3Q_14725 [Terriglobales bacterium]